MARTITEIQTQLIDNYVTTAAANGITIDPAKWSRFNLQKVWTFIVASAIALFEQVLDAKKVELEALGAAMPVGTDKWVQAKTFEFQYSASVPQVLQLNLGTLAFEYPAVNTALRIITRCSVNTDLLHIVKVKVAKGITPIALANAEKSALQSYLNILGFSGVSYQAISLNADQLYLAAEIYYQGIYANVILANVSDAINNYLANIPFDGIMKLSDLEGAIRSTVGVNDVMLTNVSARADATTFGSGTDLILNNTELQRIWQTQAGYIIPETTSSQTLADTLTFIAQ